MPSFYKYIEIPIRISYEYQPFEHATQTYPGVQEQCDIEDVEICTEEGKPVQDINELIKWVYKDNDLEADAWDNEKGE